MKIICALLLLFLPGLLPAQADGYFVDLVQGEATLQRGSTKKILLPRTKLLKTDIIHIQKDAAKVTVGKFGKEIQYIELEKKGSYKLGELFSKGAHKAHGIMEKYLHFLWTHIAFPEKDLSKLKSSDLAAWGGIVRGGCNLNHYPFDKMLISQDKIPFRWKRVPGVEEFLFTIYTETEEEVLRLSTRDTILVVYPVFFSRFPGTKFSWTVNTADERCKTTPKNKFTLLPAEQYELAVQEALKSIGPPTNTEGFLNAARILEQQGLYEAATEYLKKAVLDK